MNKKKGIQLSSITTKELIDKWNGNLKVIVRTLETEKNKLTSIIEQTKLVLADFSKYTGLATTVADIESGPYDSLYKITYNSKDSSYKITDFEAEYAAQEEKNKKALEEYNYPDGHLRYISTYIVNGKQVVYLEGASYDKETRKYYLASYIPLIDLLGIELQKTGDVSYRWKIGNNTFKADISGDHSIKKNGKQILKYSAHKRLGITVQDFELISNATVVIDEKKEAVIINSKK